MGGRLNYGKEEIANVWIELQIPPEFIVKTKYEIHINWLIDQYLSLRNYFHNPSVNL